MAAIMEIAEKYGAVVIEDAACALGAELKGRKAGTWGAMGCFSFHPRKAITTGEGGIVTTNDAALARKLRMLRNHGLDPDSSTPDFAIAGFNLRMTEFQAALGSTQMAKLERIIERRRACAGVYDQLLADSPVTTPKSLTGSRHVYQSYVTLLPEGIAAVRPSMISSLKAAGVETTIGTYHMPLATFYRQRYGFQTGDFPITDSIAARALTLPLFENLTRDQQEQVTAAIQQVTSNGFLQARAAGYSSVSRES
jgi:dTDP-4-amino-4,6-dideoxygalactose transaminase